MTTRQRATFLSFLFLLAGGIHLLAQKKITQKDTTVPVDSSKFFFFTETEFDYGLFNDIPSYPLFNRLDGFQDYHPRQAGLGNAGAPEKNLSLPTAPSDAFRRGPNNFASFGFSPDNRRFYNSEKPYTKLQYILGQKQEMNVSVIHAHPFGKNCNIAFGFDRTRSTGFYKRQNTNNTSVNLNGWYRAPGRRYSVLSDIYWTSINVAENGGLENDSAFEFSSQLDRQLVAVNLLAATNKQRLRGAWVKQYWCFGNVTDTLSQKTDSTDFKTKIRPNWGIVHTISMRDEIYQYLDDLPDAGYYETIYRDSDQTNDSTYLWRMENGLWLQKFGQGPFTGKIGARYEFGEIKMDTIYRPFDNLFLDGAVTFVGLASIVLHANGWYVPDGYNKGDYKAALSFYRHGNNGLVAEMSRLHPAFVYTGFSGNHFRWQNDFSQSDLLDVHAYWLKFFGKETCNLFGGTAGWKNYYKPLYFDSLLLPSQYDSSVNAFYANLKFNAGTKHFRVSTDILYTNVPASSPIRLPEWVIRGSVYGDFFLFKSALRMQAGVDVTWFSAYNGDAYNPGFGQFYIQDEKTIGNYVFLDPWVSIKIKPVRVFIKADHVNAGFSGRNYYLVPHNPANDFALKFGMSWVFND